MKSEESFIYRLQKIFITREIFDLKLDEVVARIIPLEKIGYGVVTLIVTAVIGAVIAGVIYVRK